jgi:hypothetical protein
MRLEIGLKKEAVELIGNAVRDWSNEEWDRSVLDACDTSERGSRVDIDDRPETNSDISMSGIKLPSA